MILPTNHRFVAGYTHDECHQQTEDDVCLLSEWNRIHFPPGDDWNEMHSRLVASLLARQRYWENQGDDDE